jgi:gliding motility-associated-like protein
MEIYNRWGELLFHTSDLEDGWDGVFKGSLSPEDTYVFKISATDPNGRVVVENGTVNLLRKDY